MQIGYLFKRKYSLVRPFIYKKSSITNICLKMLLLLFIQIVCLAVYKNYRSLVIIGACTLASVAVYAIQFFLRKDQIYGIFSALVQGIITGMLLPENYPPVVSGVLSFVIFYSIRYIAPNPSNVWVNIVAFIVVIAWFIGKQFFPDFLITPEMLEMKNPSLSLIQNGSFPVLPADSLITSFLNNYVFKFLKVSVPEGYISFLWDSHSSIPAFRFNILTILSSIVLFADDSVDFTIPSIFVFVYAVLVRLFAPMIFGGSFYSGDIILALFSSGTLFTGLFLLQWFGTTPSTKGGKIFYGIFSGIMAFILVGAGTSPVGMVYTILIGNIMTVVIKVLETRKEIHSVKFSGVTE